MPSEVSRRNGSFDAARSAPVVFADGSTWFVPRPSVMYRPVFRDRRAVRIRAAVGYHDEAIDDLVEAIGADGLDAASMASGVATLSAWLLQRNYDLGAAELDRLLCLNAADPASFGWLSAVVDVATRLPHESAAAEKGGE